MAERALSKPTETNDKLDTDTQYVDMGKEDSSVYHHPSIFQLGSGKDRYTLTISLVEILNAHVLTVDDEDRDAVSIFFHFAGVDVRSPVFSLNPETEAGGNTMVLPQTCLNFDISSTANDLMKFLEFQKVFKFFLCSESGLMATANVPMNRILHVDGGNIVTAKLIDFFVLAPITQGNDERENSSKASDSAYLKVEISVVFSDGSAIFTLEEDEGKIDTEGFVLSSNKVRQAALWEVESWKRKEEEAFVHYLQEKEKNLMNVILEEWRDAEKKRIRKFESSVKQLAALQDRLIKLLGMVERKEKQVAGDILKLNQDKESLRLSFASEIQELQSKLKLQMSENSQVMRMEKWRTTKLVASKNQQSERIKELTEENERIQREFNNFKQRFQHANAGELQVSLAVIQTEKKDLQRRLQEVTAEREHYKRVSLELMEIVEDIKDSSRTHGDASFFRGTSRSRGRANITLSPEETSGDPNVKEKVSDMRGSGVHTTMGDITDSRGEPFSDSEDEPLSDENMSGNSGNTTNAMRRVRNANRDFQENLKKQKENKISPASRKRQGQMNNQRGKEEEEEIHRLKSVMEDLLNSGWDENEDLIVMIREKIKKTGGSS